MISDSARNTPGSVFIIAGAPFSGKEAAAKLVADKAGVAPEHIISSGMKLRANTELSPDQAAIRDSGGLVSPDTFKQMLIDEIERVPLDLPLVLDGVCKMAEEAPWLIGYLASIGRQVAAVFWIEINKEAMLERAFSRGRADDAPDRQLRRWNMYESETLGSIAFFRRLGLVIRINGLMSQDAVLKRLSDVSMRYMLTSA